jgi:type VI secretion system protein ImpJ
MSGLEERGERRRRRRAHDVPAAIRWYEGMLLAPQHFQLAGQRQEALLHYHASAVSPFHWGLVDLDGKKLVDGVLSIDRVEALLPDGLVVAGAGLSIDLAPRLADIAAGQRTVFLSVAARQPGERFSKRYDYVDEPIVDETTGLDELQVTLLRPNLQLTLADYLPESSAGFPIAKVVARSGALEEDEFEPPWVRVREGFPIHKLCAAVAELLREQATALNSSIVHDSESKHAPQLLETRMLIHSLVSGLPALEVLLKSNAAHPFALYLALASVAGGLAPGTVPKRVDAYDHDDLLRVFTTLKSAIEWTVKTAIRAPYTLRPFNAADDAFSVRIEPAWVGRPMWLGVRAAAGVKAKDLDDWVMQSTIGAKPKIDGLRLKRLSGVKREPDRNAERLPASGVAFYALKPPYGELLLPSEDLVIANGDRERRPDEVVLYIETKV